MILFRYLGRLLRFLWRLVDYTCRFGMNLFALAAFVAIILVLAHPAPSVPHGAALLVRPAGNLVEQRNIDPSWNLLSDEREEETVLSGLLEAVRTARDDARIKMLVLETDQIEASGLSKYDELRAAIADFKASGKPVLARGEHFGQGPYYLASVADEIHLAPDGSVRLEGLARFNTYFRGALDKLGIKVHLFRAGEYKSFGEPFTRSNMSDEDREATRELLDGLWSRVRSEIVAARKLSPEQFDRTVHQFRDALVAANGDRALAARTAGLVDHISTRDQWRARIKEKLGGGEGKEDKKKDYLHIDANTYLTAIRSERPDAPARIAVLVAQGTIIDGEQHGAVGGDSFARLIREAREDKRVKAVVLRIDSPGGSAWASEIIRHELELTRKAGKPVVASMSSVAASGGYWIASAADEIFAAPATLTGSIGVFGMFPEFAEPLDKLGIGVDGVATAPLAAALDPRRPLDPDAAEILQLDVEHIYRRFLGIVAEARKKEPAAVDQVARGRVWSGAKALELGLVDQIGGLEAALAAAARRASLDSYAITWPTQPVSPMRLLAQQLLSSGGNPGTRAPSDEIVKRFTADLKSLMLWKDPRHIYAHCLCEMP